MKEVYAVKGHLCYAPSPEQMVILENGYMLCEDGKVLGVFEALPEAYGAVEVKDYGDRLIVPGLTDLHMHAPQYAFRSMGMDMELMEWLNTHTFPEEAKYADLDYAKKAYDIFAEDLKSSGTTRAVIFATLHVPATKLLMELLDKTGVKAYVGKVNMDRNCPDNLCEGPEALEQTRQWLEDTLNAYDNIRPILTPRFTPACTPQLMEGLGVLQREYGLPVQSHLSENPGEMAFVRELHPESQFYGETYQWAGLFGSQGPSIMAHCVHSCPEEVALMKAQGVYVAHCPQSNTNLASGIAPVRKYLDMGMHMGLGSDIAGGYSMSIFRAMADAIGMSKMYWRYIDSDASPLTVSEAFYLGTKGGGSFFGSCGSFEPGYAADFLVLDDSALVHPQPLDVEKRLERLIFLGDERQIYAKYVEGRQIF